MSDSAVVPKQAPKLSILTLCKLMDKCLPEDIENESDFQKMIDVLWPELVKEFELVTDSYKLSE